MSLHTDKPIRLIRRTFLWLRTNADGFKHAAAPHGGNVVQLPDSAGSVEIVSNVERGQGQQENRGQVAYFYLLLSARRHGQAEPRPHGCQDHARRRYSHHPGTTIRRGRKFASEAGTYPDNFAGRSSSCSMASPSWPSSRFAEPKQRRQSRSDFAFSSCFDSSVIST